MNRHALRQFGEVWVIVGYLFIAVTAVALTPRERKIVQHAVSELRIGIEASGVLRQELEGARAQSAMAQSEADSARDSAAATAVKAEVAENQVKEMRGELIKCATQNTEMRSIVDQVSGPWWFPGLNALIYGIKKCTFSLLIITAAAAVIFFLLKFLAPGALTAIKFTWSAAVAFVKRLLPKRKPKP